MSMTTSENGYYVDNNGVVTELPEGTKLTTPAEQERNKKFTELQDKKALKKMEYQEYGNFVWGKYQVSQPYVEQLSGATITRLMFLATYMDYDGALVGDNYGGKGNARDYLTKKDIQKLLKLKDTTFTKFWSELQDNQLISEINDRLYLSQEMFARGKVNKKALSVMADKDYYITRLYSNAIRDIYTKSKTTTHTALSYIFRMIPFVNRKYNVLCFNPLEEDFSKIKYMTVGDFCDQVGYDRGNATRLFHELYKPTFVTEKGEQAAVRYVSGKNLRKESFYIFVSPRVYYAKTEYDRCQINEILELEEDNQCQEKN